MITVFSLITFPGLQCLLLGHSNDIPRRPERWAPEGHPYLLHTWCVNGCPVSGCLLHRRKEITNRHEYSYFCISFLNHLYRSALLFSMNEEGVSLHGLTTILSQVLGHPKPTLHNSIFPRVLSGWLQGVLLHKEATYGGKSLSLMWERPGFRYRPYRPPSLWHQASHLTLGTLVSISEGSL